MRGTPSLVTPLDGPNRKLVAAALAAIAVLALVFTVHAVAAPEWQTDLFVDGPYYGTLVLAFLVCIARSALRGTERTPWLLLGLGMFVWTAGDLYWTVVLADVHPQPFPSLSDALYLAAYPFWYVALGLLVRSRVGEFSPSMWADGLVAGLAVAAMGAAVVFDRVLSVTE